MLLTTCASSNKWRSALGLLYNLYDSSFSTQPQFFFLPDTRDPHCRAATYDDVLPKASIIIIFTNEAWSPLIRTVWSVLDNTEAEHLHEIILVDDFSDKTHLKGKLTRYIQKKFPSKVKLLRLKSRLVQFTYLLISR